MAQHAVVIDYALPRDFSATVEMTEKVSLVRLYGVSSEQCFFVIRFY